MNKDKVVSSLSIDLDNDALSDNLCPLCGCELIKIGTDREYIECRGQQLYDEIDQYGCSDESCNYVVE